MSDLRELYQEVILDHSKKPRNFRSVPEADRTQEGFNPLCGDRLTLYVKMDGDRIEDIGFQGSGCAISKASASMMTATVKGKSQEEVANLFEKFHAMVAGKPDGVVNKDGLGKLAVFAGVREFPARVKCASLAWHTLRAALRNDQEPVSTE